jgi:uncharacterized protein (DUF1697 family)
MARYAAFLRGINLGKARRVSSADLCAPFSAAGLEDVASFRASGNVVFEAPRASGASIERRIEEAISAGLGFQSDAFVRSEAELAAIAAHEPFDAEAVTRSQGKLQVVLLKRKPSAAQRKAVLALATDADQLDQDGRELYWLPSAGLADAAIGRGEFERILGSTTTRTMGTMQALVAKFF